MRSHLHDLRAEVDDQEMVDRFAADWRAADLDDETLLLLEYVEQLTSQPATCGRSEVERLRAAGLSERAIHDAVQICSYFNYINRIADALGVEPEAWMDELGRPCGDHGHGS